MTIGLAIYSAQLAATVAKLGAQATATAIQHRKQIYNAVAKAKAKARIQRTAVAAVPLAGVGLAIYFEEQEFDEWKLQNPEGSRRDYACEVASLSVEVIDDALQGLPEKIRPSKELITQQLPNCNKP